MDFYNKYYEGIFWLSDNEDNKIISTLYIDERGIATITSLKPFREDENVTKKWNKENLVFGYINSNDKSQTYSIKLYDVYKTHQTIGSLTKYKYQSNNSFIFSGYDNDIKISIYNTILLSSDLINNWIPITGFNFKSEIENTFKISQLYEQPQRIELFKNNDFDIYLFFRASSGSQGRRNSYIKENIFINIECNKSFEIKELFKIKTVIERLFNILLFIPFYSNIIEFRTDENKAYSVIKKNNILSSTTGKKINFSVFRENSQNIISNWLDKQEKLELVILNFFSVYGQKGVLVENKFLTYISILENYHKNNINNKGYLKSRLNYLLEKSSINSKINDIENYAEKLKITRNYHAHLEEKHKEKSLNTNEIIKTNILLEFVIREIFLRELEIDENSQVSSVLNEYLKSLND
ncbi:HEPN domain-containing protein [uncultured Lutibacter sp.]|uniref:ApeA N-terminal domain 1-containing protein n=1 Tax=uncultured Lutibacter sp. TaxID=437739 RepID=UPI002606C72F|nr:HEPN domain-containing protein [uncultured Lutibacter sp.]